MSRKNLFGMSINDLRKEFEAINQPRFRAAQVADWIYKKGVVSFSAMRNIPKELQMEFGKLFYVGRAQKVKELISADGRTTKILLGFEDNVAVETVLMRQSYGNSICVSSQAGCNMKCAFCASTIKGMERNLTYQEMLAQTIHMNAKLAKEDQKVDTIVIMGSGEPLTNYDNVIKYIRFLHESYCLNMGYRNITLSTCGIVPGINKLVHEGIPINLSISLHAPNNELRSQLMPINDSYPIEEVVKAADWYAGKTGRRITYEYILIEEVNDTLENAKELVRLLKGKLASVNLIPINPVTERNWKRPSAERINFFKEYLTDHHINTTVRKEMGQDISAACGQLRNKNIDSGKIK